MKKRTGRERTGTPVTRLAALTAAFVLGAALGSLLMGRASGTAALLVEGLLDSPRGGAARQLLWNDLALLLMIFAAGFVRAAPLLCAAALALKGLLLSLTVTACVGALGGPGWGAAFALVFGSGFLGVAAMLLLALQALQPCGRRLRGHSRPDGCYFLTAGLCAAILGASELVFLYLAPPLARAAVALFD